MRLLHDDSIETWMLYDVRESLCNYHLSINSLNILGTNDATFEKEKRN